MLVISRKVDDAFFVGDDVKITLVEIRGQRARIAIEAPTSTRIWRQEIGPQPKDSCGSSVHKFAAV